MDDNAAMEIDPDIAAAMGFSGFGAQPSKKRKFDRNDGFVDPSLGQQSAGTGANTSALGERKAAKPNTADSSAAAASSTIFSEGVRNSLQQSGRSSAVEDAGPDALCHGVRNERGDTVYFLPSFIEDPWAKLRLGG